MTTKEIAVLKNKLFSRSFDSLDIITKKAEEFLFKIIVANAEKLDREDGKLVSSTGNIVSVSQAVESAFEQFRKGPQIDIIKNMLKAFDDIGSLNESYFKIASDEKKKYDDMIARVEKNLRQRAGIGAKGQLVKGGFLYNLVNDTSIKAGIQAAAQKAVVSKLPFKDYMEMMRNEISGTPDLPGPVTQHYRTFAHDAYMIYDADYGNQVAQELGLNRFVYQGGLIETSREFCRLKNGKVFTREQAETEWPIDPTLLKTKQEKESGILVYNPIEDRGRWNCRHHLNWII